MPAEVVVIGLRFSGLEPTRAPNSRRSPRCGRSLAVTVPGPETCALPAGGLEVAKPKLGDRTYDHRPGELYAICLVKNEEDIIGETLAHAAGHCKRIFVLDNGSTDTTWELVQALSRADSTIVPFGRTFEPYRRSLRSQIYYEIGSRLPEDAWWLVLDADEFLAEDPQPVIRQAVQEGADVIRTWQIAFYFTDVDLRAWEEGKDSRSESIVNRRRYYRIDSQEKRLFRNWRNLRWTDGNVPEDVYRMCKRRIFNRHYRFRDPDQMAKRLLAKSALPSHPRSSVRDWRAMVVDSRKCDFHRDGDPWRFHFWFMTTYYRKKFRRRLRNKWHRVMRWVSGMISSENKAAP